jgi:outer membrane protein assembly factor BamB
MQQRGALAITGGRVWVPFGTDGVRAVRVDSAGRVQVLWHASGSVAGSPVVGGGRVWALDYTAGVLHALDPTTGQTRGQVSAGQANRFATPAIYGNLVLVPTLTGVVFVRTS